jgi:hypothetical protein
MYSSHAEENALKISMYAEQNFSKPSRFTNTRPILRAQNFRRHIYM